MKRATNNFAIKYAISCYNRPIPLCGRRAMHAGSLVSKLLLRKMAVVRLAVLLGRINDYFLLNPRCDRRCFHRSM